MRVSNNGAQSPPSTAGNNNNNNNTSTNANVHTHQHHHHHHNNNNNNNNNSSSSRSAAGSNTENSGSQYAMCALGVGLVALGIVMIVWSVVPADAGKNDGGPSEDGGGGEGGGGGGGGAGGRPDNRNKVSSVAFVLVGSGVVMLLLSLCLGIRNKQREQQGLRDAETSRQAGVASGPRVDAETAEEYAQRFAVPSYEEVVGSGQYPIRQSNLRHSSTHLPSYEDLVEQADGLQFENEGTAGVAPAAAAATATPALTEGAAPNRRAGKTARKLLHNKIRRIKSEKLHLKNADNSQPPAGLSIEPLTPPPQYEDKVPPI